MSEERLGFVEWYAKYGGLPVSDTMPVVDVIRYAEAYADYVLTFVDDSGHLRASK